MRYIVGIDMGGTKCAVLLGTENGASPVEQMMLDRAVFQTADFAGAEAGMQRITQLIDALCEKHTVAPGSLVGIGISCGGPLNSATGTILNPPNLYGWNNVPICELLQKRYGVPVRLENDANACALAEHRFGAARGYANFVFLTCGTGMGAGIVLNGKLYHGASNMAGEIGHIRLSEFGPVGYGKAGSFEGFCSGSGIAQIAQAKAREYIQCGKDQGLCRDLDRLHAITTRDVALAAEQGDPMCIEILRLVGTYLGRGIAILIDILNPELVILGSVYQRSEQYMRPAMEEWVKQESLELSRAACKIVPAQLGDSIGDFAALALAATDV